MDTSLNIPKPGGRSRGPLPHARVIPLADYNNRNAGQACHVIGKGVTNFDYERLAEVSEPIFFLNDAVCLEKYASGDSFFFAHDKQLLPWLDGSLRSTAVLPIDGKVFTNNTMPLNHSAGVVYYHWREGRREKIIAMSRDELAREEILFTHSGTIHTAIHFIWYCGFTRITLIGCDGIPRTAESDARFAAGHDPRLENRSQVAAAWQYYTIRQAQDAIMKRLGLEAVYVGTPLADEGVKG